jgi:C4-dicarboxylate-specific signal transduction histidine kinase
VRPQVAESHSSPVEAETLHRELHELRERVRMAEERRRALLHIMADLNTSNRRLADQRRAMLHILGDYESDRTRLGQQTERLDNSRRALLNILKDSHESNLRLERSRRAMIHIMGDLRETTAELARREQELREKQAQLVQAGKLATLGELTTGVAHELNNPLNNIGLFVGNAIERLVRGEDREQTISDLREAVEQLRRATEIISHLRTFGRAAPVQVERVDVREIVTRALSFVQEQLRLRDIALDLDLEEKETPVDGNPIQLEQVVINLLTNARDALDEREHDRRIRVGTRAGADTVTIVVADNGPGIAPGLDERIFDPFFTTKDVGHGTGLGLSISYGIVAEHRGAITVDAAAGGGAEFTIELPRATGTPPGPVLA